MTDASGNETPGATHPTFVATDLGAGLYSLDVSGSGIPGPTNFALETGGVLNDIEVDMDTLLTNMTSLLAATGAGVAQEAGGNLAAIAAALAGILAVQQSPVSSTPLVLAAGGHATRTSADIVVKGKGIIVTVTIANLANSPTWTLTVQGKTLSGTYYTLWTVTAALTGNGTAIYELRPEALATANGVTEAKISSIPGTIRLVLTYAGNGTTDAADTTVNLDMVP